MKQVHKMNSVDTTFVWILQRALNIGDEKLYAEKVKEFFFYFFP